MVITFPGFSYQQLPPCMNSSSFVVKSPVNGPLTLLKLFIMIFDTN